MTVRTKTFAGVTVHAGTPQELAEVALEYAAGKRGNVTEAQARRLERCAAELRNGAAAAIEGRLRFWTDAPDGRPFDGPHEYQPEPDPAWVEAERRRTQKAASAPNGRSET